MMAGSRLAWFLVFLQVLPQFVSARCDNKAQIAIASVFSTLGFILIILIIVYIVWYCRKKAKRQAATDKQVKGLDNKSFENDIEMQQKSTRANGSAFDRDLPSGYVPCKEHVCKTVPVYQSSKLTVASTSAATMAPKMYQQFSVQRTASKGSLDQGVQFHTREPEVYNVSLRSQDIIGLGFNISGSLSDGIFISMIHNRGPASESGLIKVGDRILSITISMENIVYEDALTILSYASPYPVVLRLQRPAPLRKTTSNDSTMAAIINEELSHPVYRSQSYDDIRKLKGNEGTVLPQDGPIAPRKTWSEKKLKKKDSIPEVEGKLRKWMASHDIDKEQQEQVDGGADGDDVTDEILEDSIAGGSIRNLNRLSISSYSSTISKDSIAITQTPRTEQPKSPTKKMSDYNRNEVDVMDVEQVASSVGDLSMMVNVNSSHASDVDSELGSSDNTADIMKDYFGDQPSIMEKFGLNKAPARSSYSSSIISDHSESASDSTGRKRQPKAKKPGGNIAYYLQIDEGFQPNPIAQSWQYYEYNPATDARKPRLVTAGGEESSSEDDNTTVTEEEGIHQNGVKGTLADDIMEPLPPVGETTRDSEA